MMRVKVSSRGSGKNLDISQYVGNAQSRWGECTFLVNTDDREADVWFVVEDVDDDDTMCRVPRENVVFLTAETSWPVGYYAEAPERMDVLRQFSRIYSPHDIFLPAARTAMPFLPWMINANHGPSINTPHERDLRYLEALQEVEKTRLVSVFCSTQAMTPTHRLRLRFVERLKEHLGEALDWFGNGVNPLDEKWQGIAPYRYTIVLENQSAPDVITEKLGDAYLGLAYPVYWGAANVTDHFPGESLTQINIRDLHGSLETIDLVLASDRAEQSRPFLLDAKRRVLTEHNLYARMSGIAGSLDHGAEPADVVLRTMAEANGGAIEGSRRGVLRSAGEAFNKVGEILVRASREHT